MDLARATTWLDADGDASTWPRMLLAEDRSAFVVGIGARARTALPHDAAPASVLDAARALSDLHGLVLGGVRFDRVRERAGAIDDGWAPFGPGFFFAPRAVMQRTREGVCTGVDEVERLLASASSLQGRGSAPSPTCAVRAVSLDSERVRFSDVGARALLAIESGAMQKLVLARRIPVHATLSLATLVRALDYGDTGLTYVFAPEPGLAFVGRTPETLLRGRDGTYATEAVAGTTPRARDPDVDHRARAALLGSEKDAREHALVVAHIAAACAAKGVKTTIGPRHVRTLSRLHHLVTPFVVETDAVSPVALAQALHPTPALAGTPVDAARDFIAHEEGFDRGLYGGLIGSIARDAVDLRVAIRGALVGDGLSVIYTGAGFVAGSVVARELDETDVKARALLLALTNGGGAHA
jgi:isochorismate synthase